MTMSSEIHTYKNLYKSIAKFRNHSLTGNSGNLKGSGINPSELTPPQKNYMYDNIKL